MRGIKRGNATRARRKRLTYSNLIATVALVFAMTGGAMAASHYLITSTKQIKPSVLKKLKGKAGPQGNTGPAGQANPNATAVDGQTVSKIFLNLAPHTSTTQVFSADGLSISADCTGSGGDQLGLYAQSTDPNAELNWNGNNSGFVENEDEDTGTGVFDLLDGSSPGSNQGNITVNYSTTAGKIVTVSLGFDYDGAFGSGSDCGVWGTGVSSS
jgi:hypothetical protein